MNVIAGICPNCLKVVSSKKKNLFLICEHCEETVPMRQAVAYLNDLCSEPGSVKNVIDLCLELEETEDVELPLEILRILEEEHPYNEQIAYTRVRLSGYEPQVVRKYLNTFAGVKTTPSYAEDFLENAIIPANMVHFTLFSNYIENKIKKEKQQEYRDKLGAARSDYIGSGGEEEGQGIVSMYALYIISAAVNIGMIFLFFFLDLHIAINVIIGMAIFCIELFVWYLHNKMYGNRLGISPIEMIFLIIFLSSIPIAIAGLAISALV